MPIVIDPMQDSYLRGLLERGHREGHREGRIEGQIATLRDLIAERFGGLPEWAEGRLLCADEPELTRYTKRLLHAASIAAIFN